MRLGLSKQFASVLTLSLLVAAACSTGQSTQTGSSPSGVKKGGTLVVGIVGDIARTDPTFTNDTNSWYVERQVMQGLVGLAPGSTTEVMPVLAQSWTVSSDGKTYDFKLRQGVKFHDGTAFDAAAVKYNYDRWKNLPTQLQSFAYYYGQVFAGFGSDSNIVSVDVKGTNEVAFQLKQPQSNFLIAQTQSPFALSSPAALKKGDADNTDPSKSPYQQGGNPSMVGTGPFKFKEWVPGDHVTVVRNADYWDQAHAALLDSIVFKPITNESSMLNALQSGGIDFAEAIQPPDLKIVQADPKLTVVDRGQSCTISVLDMNLTHPPLDNKNIRMAVAYALNRQSYVDSFFGGSKFAKPADNWMPVSAVDAVPLGLPTYNLAMAKQLIQQSGVTNPTIDFWYPSSVTRPYMPDPKGEFQAISDDLTAAGFRVNPHTEIWRPNYVDDLGVGKFAMWLLGWTCDWNAPDDFLQTAFFGYVNGQANPEYGYRNDALNSTMNQALAASTADQAKTLWQQAQQMIKVDLPTMPLMESNSPGVEQSYVQGLVGNGSLTEYFNTVWLNK
jgi:peptide/nickel transport system substrate-binding protein